MHNKYNQQCNYSGITMMAALWAGKSKIDQSQTIKIQNTVSRLFCAGWDFIRPHRCSGTNHSSSWTRRRPSGSLPFLPVLGGGVTVASWFVRRVDVEGGYTHLHVSGTGPSQQVVLVGSHRAARTLGFHILLRLPFRCVSVPSWAPRRCGPTLSLIGHHHGRLGGLFNDNIEATLTHGRLPRLLQAKELLQPGDTLLVGMEVPPAGVQPLLESFLSLSPLLIIPSMGQQLDLILERISFFVEVP